MVFLTTFLFELPVSLSVCDGQKCRPLPIVHDSVQVCQRESVLLCGEGKNPTTANQPLWQLAIQVMDVLWVQNHR